MKRREVLAGAPIFRGRWAAIWWLFWAGEFFGEPSLFNKIEWWELMLVGFACVFLILGLISLDQYGRNAWFAWAPDDAEWSGLRRTDVNRRRVTCSKTS